MTFVHFILSILLNFFFFLLAEGIFVFGQEQDEFGGGFSNSESLVGKLTQLDIWDKLIDPDRIKVLGKNCKKYYGSLIAWGQMQEHVRGNIQVKIL